MVLQDILSLGIQLTSVQMSRHTWNAHLNSSLVMSLGAGAWRVSGWPDAISREKVSMATLEAGTTPKAATNRHCHTEKFSGDTYLLEYLPEKYLRNHQPPSREGRRGSENLQRFAKKGTIDPLWSASKATMQYNTSYKPPKRPCNSPKGHPACHILQ